MANWLTTLVQKPRQALQRLSGVPDTNRGAATSQQKPQHREIVSALRALAKKDHQSRRQQLTAYKTWLDNGGRVIPPARRPPAAAGTPLAGFRTRVPFRLSKEAAQILDTLKTTRRGSTVVFPSTLAQQELLLNAAGPKTESLGRIDTLSDADPKLANLENHGLELVSDGKGSLQFRFTYPITPARISSSQTANQGDLSYKLRSSRDIGRKGRG